MQSVKLDFHFHLEMPFKIKRPLSAVMKHQRLKTILNQLQKVLFGKQVWLQIIHAHIQGQIIQGLFIPCLLTRFLNYSISIFWWQPHTHLNNTPTQVTLLISK